MPDISAIAPRDTCMIRRDMRPHSDSKTPRIGDAGRCNSEPAKTGYLIFTVAVPFAPVTSNESPDFLYLG